MSGLSDAMIINGAVLAVVLEADLGPHRKIGWFRVLRPVITVLIIIPFFFTTLPTAGNDLALQGAGLLAGVLLGLASVSPLLVTVRWDPAWRPRGLFRSARSAAGPASVSQAGIGYALIWIAVTAGRLAFAYGAQHVFPVALGQSVGMPVPLIENSSMTNGPVVTPGCMPRANGMTRTATLGSSPTSRSRVSWRVIIVSLPTGLRITASLRITPKPGGSVTRVSSACRSVRS